jgi:hypothetical protein
MGTVMNDARCLANVLKKRYPEVEVSSTPIHLAGYTAEERRQTAEIVVRRKHLGGTYGDLGFKKNDKGNFDAVISDVDTHKFNTKFVNQLAQDYMAEKATATMTEHECDEVERETMSNGWLRVRYAVQNA